MAEPDDPRIGMILDQRFRLERMVGEGGMGRVYAGRDIKLGRRVAVKVMHEPLGKDAVAMRRFERELHAVGQLTHLNVVAVTDSGTGPGGFPYFVMEYLEGESCAALLDRVGRLPHDRAMKLVLQACAGLVAAHSAGVVHRDVKPANLFICSAGGADVVKVLDFGIAKIAAAETGARTAAGQILGTSHYMSPEQTRGDTGVDARSDVWALGVVLYELLSGVKPFDADHRIALAYQVCHGTPKSIRELCPELDARAAAVIERCLAKDPQDRFASVTELMRDLRRTCPDLSVPEDTDLDGSNATRSARSASSVPTKSAVSTFGGRSHTQRGPGRGLPVRPVILAGIVATGAAVLYFGVGMPPSREVVVPAATSASEAPSVSEAATVVAPRLPVSEVVRTASEAPSSVPSDTPAVPAKIADRPKRPVSISPKPSSSAESPKALRAIAIESQNPFQ